MPAKINRRLLLTGAGATLLMPAAPAILRAQALTTIPTIEYYGGGVSVADNTAAFNTMVQANQAGRFGNAGGAYRFATEPDPINKVFSLYGALPGVQAWTYLVRDYQPSAPERGLFHWTGASQIYMSDFYIYAASGNGGSGISYVPPAGGGSGVSNINNVRISTFGGAWDYSMYMDGSNLSTGALGIRHMRMRNVDLFGANIISGFFKGMNHFYWHGSANQAGGINGNIKITGTSAFKTSETILDIDSLSSDLLLDYVKNSVINVATMYGRVKYTGNTSGIVGSGKCLGGAPMSETQTSGTWVDSSWRDGRTIWQSPT